MLATCPYSSIATKTEIENNEPFVTAKNDHNVCLLRKRLHHDKTNSFIHVITRNGNYTMISEHRV